MSIEPSKIKDVFIYVDSGIIRKYSDPYLYGSELSSIMKNAAYNILREIELEDKILIVKILEGGRFYYIDDALKRIGKDVFDEAEIDIKSRFKYDPDDVVTKVVKYGNVIEKLKNKDMMILGETIASGSTMETFIDVISKSLKDVKKLILLGFHTYVGIERTIEKLKEYDIEYRIYSYGGLLGLGPNKTDMTIGYTPNQVPDNVRERVYRKLGSYLADHLCVIGDFTYSFKYISKYLAERVIQLRELFDSSPRNEKFKVMQLIREGIARLMRMGIPVSKIEDLLSEEYKRRMKLIGQEIDRRIILEDILNDEMFKS